jgi:hypothetical protein
VDYLSLGYKNLPVAKHAFVQIEVLLMGSLLTFSNALVASRWMAAQGE